MKQEDLIKILLIAGGAYIAWAYIIQPWMAQQQTATAAGGLLPGQIPPGGLPVGAPPAQTPTTMNTSTAVVASQGSGSGTPSPQLTTKLQQLAGASMMTPDQWAYYFNTLGTTISANQMEATLAALGLTDATRTTSVSASQFTAALAQVGVTMPTVTFSTLQSARGVGGIVPGWPSGGGPAFNAFVPGGFGGGGFSSYNRGFRAAPKTVGF